MRPSNIEFEIKRWLGFDGIQGKAQVVEEENTRKKDRFIPSA